MVMTRQFLGFYYVNVMSKPQTYKNISVTSLTGSRYEFISVFFNLVTIFSLWFS